MPSQSSLAIKLTRAHGVDAGLAIEELVKFELGIVSGQGLLQVAITALDDAAQLTFGKSPIITISKDEALNALAGGCLVVGLAISKWQPQMQADMQCSVEDGYRQRDALEAAYPRISFPPNEIVATAQFERSRQVLERHGKLAIVGPSSSGKTVIVDGLRQFRDITSYLWVDLADPMIGLAGFLMAACRAQESNGQALIVLDDIQCSPGLARSILQLLSETGVFSSVRTNIVAVAWPDGLEIVEHWFGDETIVRSNGAEACRRIVQLAEPSSRDAELLMALANGDALVAELATTFLCSRRRAPTREELAAECFETLTGAQKLSVEELESLWEIGCLGIFEIDARLDLITQVSQSVLDSLVEKRVLRRKSDFVFFGHRSAARLVTYHLQRCLEDGTDRSPIRLAVRYLRRAGESQIKQTLDRLDLVAVANEEDQFGAAFLAHCWNNVKILISHLGSLVREDPTWGDNVASAIFAGEALAQLGLEAEWELIANYVRSRWILSDEEILPQHTEGDTAEADDFRAIKETMTEEDRLDPRAFTLKADEVDVDRFHRTWVMGLLAGFEATALIPDFHRAKELRRMIQESQQPDGSFYPSRVPWITARVCLGLAALGETTATSPVLQRASEWLRRRAPVGPFRFGSWRSGTGTWNTELQMTAMALLALGRMGVEPSDQGVRSALAYLKDGRSEWYRPGKEIDCAQAIEAALVLGDTWRDFSSELRSLLEWAQDSRAWADARVLASVAQDESSKVPAVASALISVIWETVKFELPLLFQGVVGGALTSDKAVVLATDVRDGILHRLEHVAHVIEQGIRDRNSIGAKGALPTIVAERLRKLAGQEIECQKLLNLLRDSDHLQEISIEDLIARVNALGADVLGAAWEAVPIS
jgi:hypothetical protein